MYTFLSKPNILLLITLILSTIFGVSVIQTGHDWGGDFALYLSEAEALKTGELQQLYQLNKFTVDHSDVKMLSPYLYPLGFPLILSCVDVDTPNFVALKVLMLLFFVGVVFLFFLITRQLSGNYFIALITASFIGFHFQFFSAVNEVLSDLPFTFFCLLSMFAIYKVKNKSVWFYLGVGLLIGFSFLIRANGVFLLATLLLYQVLHKTYQQGWVKNLMPYIGFALIFIINHYYTHQFESNYFKMFELISLTTVKSNLTYYLSNISGYLFGSYDSIHVSIKLFQLLLVVGFCVLAIVKKWRIALPLVAFVALSLALYLVWPSRQGLRFVFPIMPIIVWLFIEGAFLIQQKNVKHLILGVCIALVVVNSIVNVYLFSKMDTNQAFTKDAIEMYNFVKMEVPENGVLNFEKPRVLRHFTQRNAVVQHQFNLSQPQVWEYLVTDTVYTNTDFNLNLIFKNASFNIYHLKN